MINNSDAQLRSPSPLLDLLRDRTSTPSRLMLAPGPTRAELLVILQIAMHVPDHGKLTPWRFVLIENEQRARLGELLVRVRLSQEPDASSDSLAKEAQRFSNAPCIVAVIGCLSPKHKVPEREQLLSGGALCMQLLLAAHASGFAAQWLTGWMAYDPDVGAALDLVEHELLLGFMHLGSAAERGPERARPDAAQRLSVLQLQ